MLKVTHYKHREIQAVRSVTGTVAQLWKDLKNQVGRNDTYHITKEGKLIAEVFWDWRLNMSILKFK